MKTVSIKSVMKRQYAISKYLKVICKSKQSLKKLSKIVINKN